MKKEIFNNYIKAGKVAGEVREESRRFIKPGMTLLEIAEYIENEIRERGAKPAFPVNLSLNDIAAHYTPANNDETIFNRGDILKIDIGTHVNGYVGDCACTLYFGNDKEKKKLVEASELALSKAIKLCTPNTLLSDISKKIEETIKSHGFVPVSNLTGHGLDKYNIHAQPQIPNVKFTSDYRLKKNQVIAIEPFATNGAGKIKESEPTLIFCIPEKGPVRNQDARKIISFAQQFQGLPFAERWIPIESIIKVRLALRELRMKNIVYEYPVLKEVNSGLVSQAEHTVIVRKEPIVTTL